MGIIKKLVPVVNWLDSLFTNKASKASLLANYVSWYNEDGNWLRNVQANGQVNRMLWHQKS